ncbi:MAG: hypothetical protein LQ352_001966 [Teloschistes flavicans]|nr:MAG: hypothetical protein LQ352_001966 [Teloschistes flavicans]
MANSTTSDSDPQDFLTFTAKLVKAAQKDASVPLESHFSAIESYLHYHILNTSSADNHAAATQLQDWIISVISPTDIFAEENPYGTVKDGAQEPSASLVACLASFTDAEDPWTGGKEARGLAKGMLSIYLKDLEEEGKAREFEKLIVELLREHVKPLFVRSKSPILTDAGRKALSPLPDGNKITDMDSSNKPWKFHSPHIVTVFRWVLAHMTSTLVSAHWPLVIPPILTILDDVSIAYKIRGCQLLQLLLDVAPASLLERSGLGEVFHDTLIPYLLYLPSLTPEEESLPLLDATYDTLIALTLARYPTSESGAKKIKALDAIFRYGILKGHAHAGENVRIAKLLMEKSSDLVGTMGIYCVRHLKDLLPMVSATLTAPFALAYPPLLTAALGLLRAVIAKAWPRVGYHRGEILEGLLVCWCRTADDDEPSDGVLKVRADIEEVARTIVRIIGDDEDGRSDLRMLKDHDSRLQAILAV